MADIRNSNKGSLGNRSTDNNFNAAASEKLRIDEAKKQRVKNEQERTRAKLTELQRKMELNKREISAKKSDASRVSQEIIRAEAAIRALEYDFKNVDTKIDETKIHVRNFEGQLAAEQKEANAKKLVIQEKKKEELKLQGELSELQRKLADTRREMNESEQRIKELDLDITHIEGIIEKNAGAGRQIQSEKAKKETEVERKKKDLYALEQKKKAAEDGEKRLELEDEKLESDIRILESKLKE